MFDPRLTPLLDQLSAQTHTARVLAARVYRLPFVRVRARVALQQPRRVNVLEEFILRAAAELTPPPTAAELAELLGLDQLFVDNAVQTLEQAGVVRRMAQGLQLTPAGQKAQKHGQVPQAPEYKALRLLYLPATAELRVWDEQWKPGELRPADTPLPGLPTDRETVSTQALEAVTVDAIIDALDLARLDWHAPKQNRVLAEADQLAVEEAGVYGCGVLVLQQPDETIAARVVRAPSLQPDSALEEVLNQWLATGRLGLGNLLPGATADGSAVVEDVYRTLAATPDSGVTRLSADQVDAQLVNFVNAAQHTLFVLQPTLEAEALPANLGELGEGRGLTALATRGVFTILGWGAAAKPEAETRPPAPSLQETWHRLTTPEGYPAVATWWVGELVGCDLVADQQRLFSTLPDTIAHGGQHFQLGQKAYHVTHLDLVLETLENLEPALARAARTHWQTNAKYPQAGRVELERCCLTWVSARRPGEAFSHLLKLAASGPALLPLVWELFTVTGLALARLPEETLTDMAALDALARTLPDLLARDPASEEPATDYVGRLKQLLAYYAEGAPRELVIFLGEMRDLWTQLARKTPGQTIAAYFTALEETAPKEVPKKKPVPRATKPTTGSLNKPKRDVAPE